MAIVLVSLAPAISGALASQSGDGWVEVCTTLGTKVADVAGLGGKRSSPTAPALHVLDHCPYCTMHLAGIGLEPTPFAVSLLSLGFAVPRLFLHGPYTLHAWYRALSRGPPSEI